MLKSLIFILIALKFHPSRAIECNFTIIDLTMYGCEVLKDQFNETQEILTGNHTEGKSDSDVTALFINGQNEVEFQSLFCRVFQNLKLIHIERLEFAQREDFKDCKNVQTFKIIATQLYWLPEDVFYDMTELRVLKLVGNKLVYLPADFLAKNTKLEKFLAQDNRLEVIELQFGMSVKEVDLGANKCIHRSAPSAEVKSIESLNQLLRTHCSSSTYKKLQFLQNSLNSLNSSQSKKIQQDLVKISGSAIEFEAEFPQSKFSSESGYKIWFYVLIFFTSFLMIGWAGSAYLMLKRMNDITNGDHQFLMNMDFNGNRDGMPDY